MRLSAAGKMVQWEWRRLGEGFANVQLGEFVVMPNHVHGIIFIHGAERATRTGQNLIMEEECRLPDDTGIEIVGSPVQIDGANVGATHPSLVEPNSGTASDLNIARSGTDGSPGAGMTMRRIWKFPPLRPIAGGRCAGYGNRCRGWGWIGREGDPNGAEFDYGRGMPIARRCNGRHCWVARTHAWQNVRATHLCLSMRNSGPAIESNMTLLAQTGRPGAGNRCDGYGIRCRGC